MTKQELRECREARREISQLLDEMEALEAEVTSPKIPKMSGMPPSQPATSDRMAENVAKWVDLQQGYRDKLSRSFAMRMAVEKAMDVLTPTERQVVRAYYIQGKTWEEVCVAVNYSWRETHRKHASALKKMAVENE
jgi:DNA-directed RNA polymerase specialized sigma24 family protein